MTGPEVTDAEVLSDLARVKALFQLRTIEMVIRGEVTASLEGDATGSPQSCDPSPHASEDNRIGLPENQG